MADHWAGELRSFEHFSRMMTDFPYLKPIDKKRRKLLLRELYQVAEGRKQMEDMGKIERDSLPEVRADRRRTRRTVGLLRGALQRITEARASGDDDLSACEEESNAIDWNFSRFTFAEMEKHLKFSVEFLKAHVARSAADVHPKLRTASEKRLASEHMAAFNDIAEGSTKHNYLVATKATVALETWFIRMAAQCLDRYKPAGNRPLEGYDIITARLFEAAFTEIRSQGSVQKILKRRRRETGVQYTPGQPYRPISCLKLFWPNPQFLQ
jgi:hypothetical protein